MNYEFGIKNQHSAFCILHSRRGFTMIELMITIGIFVIITGTVLVNFRGGERQEELRSVTENVKSLLNQARNMTLTGQVTTYMNYSGGRATGFPPGGYGIEIRRPYRSDRDQYRFVAVNAIPGTTAYESEIWYVGQIQPNNFPIALSVIPTSHLQDIFTMVTFEPPNGAMVFRIGGGRIIDAESYRTGQAIYIRHEAFPGQYKRITLDRISGRISTE